MNSHTLKRDLSPLETSVMALTSALYDPDTFDAISKEEMRDALSDGQLVSKQWLLKAMKECPQITYKNLIVVGGWIGLLARALTVQYPNSKVSSADINPGATTVAERVLVNTGTAFTADMYTMDYSPYDMVINTSVEHIPDIKAWSDLIPRNTFIVAQSNSNADIPDHVSVHRNATELRRDLNLGNVLYCEELVFPMYKRFMVLGIK